MSLVIELEPDSIIHPVDIIEHIALINDWDFERQMADEILISVKASWCEYQVVFSYMHELESLHITCSFDLKVPQERLSELKKLIMLINEQLWIGHFDIWQKEGAIIFRNSHLLTGGADISPQQCEALLRSATDACDIYYQAFQFVVWAGKTSNEAMAAMMFETLGEA